VLAAMDDHLFFKMGFNPPQDNPRSFERRDSTPPRKRNASTDGLPRFVETPPRLSDNQGKFSYRMRQIMASESGFNHTYWRA
jgi:hypothetical protein